MDENKDIYLNTQLNKNLLNDEDKLNFREIFNFFYRNKNIGLFFFFLSTIFGIFYALNIKRTWQGEFQIVLEQNKSVNSLPINGAALEAISSFSGITNDKNQLKTEVAILKSPSVLMNIFNYVKKEKLTRNDIDFKEKRFKSWRNNSVDINLLKGTSILNLAYKDTDKDLIVPVLIKISKVYQDYSGEKKSRQITLGIESLKDQIAFYKNKSSSSEKKLIDFGDSYNLSVVQAVLNQDKENYLKLNVEVLKDEIYKLDKELALIRSIYKESDPNIQNILRIKKALIASARRPEGVLKNYKQLLNEERRDKQTIIQLENSLRLINLQKAKNEDPWRLITKPTLLPKPVAPIKRNIVTLWSLMGLLIGSLVALFNEKRKGIIYSVSEVKSELKIPLITELSLKKESNWSEIFYLIINRIISENKDIIGILITDEIEEQIVFSFKKILNNFISNNQIIISKDIKDLDECPHSILIIGLGFTKKNTIVSIKNRILFSKNSFDGVLILNNL